MAAAALSGPRRARDEPGPADARRQGLRQHVRQAHARRGPVRGPDRDAVRESAQAPRLRATAGAGRFALRRATQAIAAGRAVLKEKLARGEAPPGMLRLRKPLASHPGSPATTPLPAITSAPS